MLRWSDFILLLPPLVLIVVALRTRRLPSRRLLLAVLLGELLFGAALFWIGASRSVAGSYVPAHMDNGRILPGHGGPA